MYNFMNRFRFANKDWLLTDERGHHISSFS